MLVHFAETDTEISEVFFGVCVCVCVARWKIVEDFYECMTGRKVVARHLRVIQNCWKG